MRNAGPVPRNGAHMAIATFAQLKTAVASWLHRTDLTSVIPDFVTLCETDIKRDLRLREMEASTTVALTSTTLALPDGFLEVRRVIVDDIVQDYIQPSGFNPLRESLTSNYTVLGTNLLFQVSSGTAKVDYFKQFTALSVDGDTNWLLTNHPDIYLFGSLAWACSYTRDDPTAFRGQYLAARDRVRTTQRNSIGPLQVRPSGNTP